MGRPISQETNATAKRQRLRAVEDRVRRDRCRRAGFVSCPGCGGVCETWGQDNDDPTLACVCEERGRELQERVQAKFRQDRQRILDETWRSRREVLEELDRSERIAP